MLNVNGYHSAWRKRPADEIANDIHALHTRAVHLTQNTRNISVSTRDLEAVAVPSDNDPAGEVVLRRKNTPPAGIATFNHWSFGQLIQRSARVNGVAPKTDYLRELPAALVQELLNYALEANRPADLQLLLHRSAKADAPVLAAANSATYKRLGYDGLTTQIRDLLHPRFESAGEGALSISDRDMFAFLVDRQNPIEVADSRNPGGIDILYRGLCFWDSMVGSATRGFAHFLFRSACMNRTIFGTSQYSEMRIRHTKSAGDRYVEEMLPAIQAYAEGSTDSIKALVANAQSKRIDDIGKFLLKRFTKPQAIAIVAAHEADEARPIATIWDASNAITAYARQLPHQNARAAIERAGGNVLQLAA